MAFVVTTGPPLPPPLVSKKHRSETQTHRHTHAHTNTNTNKNKNYKTLSVVPNKKCARSSIIRVAAFFFFAIFFFSLFFLQNNYACYDLLCARNPFCFFSAYTQHCVDICLVNVPIFNLADIPAQSLTKIWTSHLPFSSHLIFVNNTRI